MRRSAAAKHLRMQWASASQQLNSPLATPKRARSWLISSRWLFSDAFNIKIAESAMK